MSNVIGPVEGICHGFELRTFGSDDQGNYTLTANVLDDDAINAIRAGVETVVKAKNVQYADTLYPPVQAAGDAGVEGVSNGIVVRARYRLDARHMSPFTLDGKSAVGPELNNAIEREMVVGRKVKFAMQFSAQPPTAQAVTRGERTIQAKPAGAVYCNLIAVMPLDEVLEIGTTIETLDWGKNKAMKVEAPKVATIAAQAPTDEVDSVDIPF